MDGYLDGGRPRRWTSPTRSRNEEDEEDEEDGLEVQLAIGQHGVGRPSLSSIWLPLRPNDKL